MRTCNFYARGSPAVPDPTQLGVEMQELLAFSGKKDTENPHLFFDTCFHYSGPPPQTPDQPPPKTVRKNPSFHITHPFPCLCTATVGSALVSRYTLIGVSPLQAACYSRTLPFRYGCRRVFYFRRMRRHRRKMLTPTVDGTIASSSSGGIARAKPEEIANPCLRGLVLMHAPVSRQQETPLPCRNRKKTLCVTLRSHSSVRLSRHTPSVSFYRVSMPNLNPHRRAHFSIEPCHAPAQ